jgi:hypothetical protein
MLLSGSETRVSSDMRRLTDPMNTLLPIRRKVRVPLPPVGAYLTDAKSTFKCELRTIPFVGLPTESGCKDR